MTRLSVNINKIATLRNARGGNMPDVLKAALDCERFGAQGITVHPRPDERHIRYSDVRALRPALKTEFNIEGNPTGSFTALVCEVIPDQVTLVPDAPDAITSNAGWDTVRNHAFLKRMCTSFKERGIRTSIFIDPDPRMAEGAFRCGADRVELYTAAYAANYALDREAAIAPSPPTSPRRRPPAIWGSASTPDTTSRWRTSNSSSAPSPGRTRSASGTPSSATRSTWAWRQLSGNICRRFRFFEYFCKLWK